ncbi:MAG: ferritin family protein [Thermoanaerobaculaceae bacterium]|nr:ferritin family protein [Thermoanaerobaculaceae bacterium]NLH11105.1 ferritin family protein [Holophagae bacterium]HPW54239.1 ferritin family protein [Thermoanaerobaculaceae bacterium]
MDLKEALTVAIDYEHRVRDHYARGTEALLDPKAKKVFETLAREEQGHITYLESRLAEWQKRGYVDSPELPTILPSVAWVQTARDRLADLPAGTTTGNEMDLLKTALELERATSGFYRSLVDTLPAGQRELFARFLAIEEGHLAIVQAEIDAVAGHGHWFDFQEFSLEAG